MPTVVAEAATLGEGVFACDDVDGDGDGGDDDFSSTMVISLVPDIVGGGRVLEMYLTLANCVSRHFSGSSFTSTGAGILVTIALSAVFNSAGSSVLGV